MTVTDAPARTVATSTVTLACADALVAAALDAARAGGLNVAVAVTDAGGHLRAFGREDGAGHLGADAALAKARTAAASGLPTHRWAEMVADPATAALAHLPGVLPIAGGYPLTADLGIVGAIGVAGGPPDADRQAAAAALAELGFPVP